MTACLDDETLGAWSAGGLPDDEAARAVEHAAACARCAAIIADAVGAATTAVATVGRFELRRLLGSGGMGVVFDAWDPLLQRPVAVKMIRALAADAADRERLIAEGRALARLAHRHVVTVYDCGSAGDEVYLAMAQVRGASLARWLDAAPRSVAERRRVLDQIADGLAAIHAAGLVHRDLKPDNVVVDERGDAVVIDLGLARALDRPARAADRHRPARRACGRPRWRPGARRPRRAISTAGGSWWRWRCRRRAGGGWRRRWPAAWPPSPTRGSRR
jgi:predicted Ser/Thr protein kinase